MKPRAATPMALLLALAVSGCASIAAPPQTVALASRARVTFPLAPVRHAVREVVDGRSVIIEAATFSEGDGRDPHSYAWVPSRLAACVMRFEDAELSVEPADFARDLREAFGALGTVGPVTAVQTAGLPGYELIMDRDTVSRRRRLLTHARTVVRVAVGRDSLAFFAVTFDPTAEVDAREALEDFQTLLRSSSIDDGLPPAGAASASPDVVALALKRLVGGVDDRRL